MREYLETQRELSDLGYQSPKTEEWFHPDDYVEIPEQTEESADREALLTMETAPESVDVPEQSEDAADRDETGTVEEITEVPEEGEILNVSDSSFSSSPEEDREIRDPQDLDEINSWLGDINPNFDEFDPDSPYCNNCGSCALAVYRRLEGSTDSCASAENIGTDAEMNKVTGMEMVSMDPKEIEQSLLEQGDGAHAIIGIDRAEGPGHWFNAACVDGKVVAIDGQTGEITDWPPDYGDVVNWEMSIQKKSLSGGNNR